MEGMILKYTLAVRVGFIFKGEIGLNEENKSSMYNGTKY